MCTETRTKETQRKKDKQTEERTDAKDDYGDMTTERRTGRVIDRRDTRRAKTKMMRTGEKEERWEKKKQREEEEEHLLCRKSTWSSRGGVTRATRQISVLLIGRRERRKPGIREEGTLI